MSRESASFILNVEVCIDSFPLKKYLKIQARSPNLINRPTNKYRRQRLQHDKLRAMFNNIDEVVPKESLIIRNAIFKS